MVAPARNRDASARAGSADEVEARLNIGALPPIDSCTEHRHLVRRPETVAVAVQSSSRNGYLLHIAAVLM